MRPALLVSVVVLAAGLAGCVGGDDPPLDTSDPPDASGDTAAKASLPTFENGTPAPTAIERRACDEQALAVPVRAAAYEDRAPPAFSLEPYGSAERFATLEVYGQACALPDGTDVARAWTALDVDPPDAWENPNATFGHSLVLSFVTTSEREAAVFSAWGFEDAVSIGEVAYDRTATQAGGAGTVEVQAGEVRFELHTTAGPGEEEGPGRERWFALGEDGTVVGAKDRAVPHREGVALGGGEAAGSAAAGMPETAPHAPAVGVHVWGFDATDTYVDLPSREGGSDEGSRAPAPAAHAGDPVGSR